MPVRSSVTTVVSSLIIGSFLAGCSSAAWKPVQRPISYETTLSPTATTSVLLFRSTGASMPVEYTVSANSEEFKPGKISYSNDQEVPQWIARFSKSINRRLAKTLTQREIPINPGTYYLISASSEWTDVGIHYNVNGSCYPASTHFTPEANKRYMALFTFLGGRCKNEIYDISSGKPKLLESQNQANKISSTTQAERLQSNTRSF